MDQIYAASDTPHVQIGTVYPTIAHPRALYVDAMLGKHFALLGSTGTGKSTSAALILHKICDHRAQGPHRDDRPARRIFRRVQPTTARCSTSTTSLMPYWLMNFEEHCEVFVTINRLRPQDRQRDSRQVPARGARQEPRLRKAWRKLTVDSPIPYLLSDLTTILSERDGQARQGHDIAALYAHEGPDRRDQGRSALQLHVLRHAGGRHDAEVHRQDVSVCPVGQADLDHRRVGRAVRHYLGPSSRFCRAWSSTMRSGRATNEPKRPILLVCEEAHRYIPNDHDGAGQSVRDLERIAKEGRKYGVSLGLITQRPSDLAEGVLSQCGTIISMRLNNDRDQAFVKAAMPEGARGFLDSIPALRNRECIICGEACRDPDPRVARRSRRAPPSGLCRSELLRTVEAKRRRRGHPAAHYHALAQSGPLK
jgi:hypothetical protein